MKGRPRSQQPTTAYDYRHSIALVQAQATDAQYAGLQELCRAWGVPSQLELREVNPLDMVRRLAQKALELDRTG